MLNITFLVSSPQKGGHGSSFPVKLFGFYGETVVFSRCKVALGVEILCDNGDDTSLHASGLKCATLVLNHHNSRPFWFSLPRLSEYINSYLYLNRTYNCQLYGRLIKDRPANIKLNVVYISLCSVAHC